MAETSLVQRIVAWLRAGYADGIPVQDTLPLLEVLHRRLTDGEVDAVTRELIALEAWPYTADGISDVASRRVLERPSDADIDRVAARLSAAGWPIEGFDHLD